MPGVRDLEVLSLRTIGGMNSGTICKESMFRGELRFRVQYSLGRHVPGGQPSQSNAVAPASKEVSGESAPEAHNEAHREPQNTNQNELLEPKEAREKASLLARKILQCFDSTLVHVNGGGWRSSSEGEKAYNMQWMCVTNNVNVTGKRKAKKEQPDVSQYVRRGDRVAGDGNSLPCCSNVRGAYTMWNSVPHL